MNYQFDVLKGFDQATRAHYRDGERAVTRAIRGARHELRSRWRAEVRDALGKRVSNTIRGKDYPEGQASMSAAAVVWTKAPHIISAHDRGATIQARDGFWLAIPMPAAGKGRFGRRLTPAGWQERHGRTLRFVATRGGRFFLVADDARLTRKTGLARPKRGRRRKSDGILTGAQTVVIFQLVPQVKLRKRFSLMPIAEQVAAGIPARIAANWGD